MEQGRRHENFIQEREQHMAKIHIEIKKVSNNAALATRYNHNLRLNPNEDLRHIDPTKSYLNHDLVNTTNVSYRELVEERIGSVSAAVNRNLRKRRDAVLALSITLSYTHGAEETNHFAVDEWEQASLKWLQNYFGLENVLSAMVHMDESSPHIHAIVTPITQDLRLCAKDFVGSPKLLSQIHQSYGEEMAKPPFLMEMPVQHLGKRATYGGIQAFYDQINKIEEFEIPQKEAEEELSAYQTRITEYVKAKERKNLEKLQQMEYKLEEAYTVARGMRIEFRQAINLYQYLYKKLGGKEGADAELFALYELEQLPEKTVQRFAEEFRQRHGIKGTPVLERSPAVHRDARLPADVRTANT